MWLCTLSTMCTYVVHANLTIHSSYFPKQIHGLAFLMKASCFLCELQTEYLYVIYINFSLWGCAMPLAVSHKPLTTKTRVWFWASPCVICGGQSGIWTGFYISTWVLPVSIIPPMLHTNPYLNTYVIQKVEAILVLTTKKVKWTQQ
jgi:hypothetical protein